MPLLLPRHSRFLISEFRRQNTRLKREDGKPEDAAVLAGDILNEGVGPELAVEAVSLGAPVAEAAKQCPPLESFDVVKAHLSQYGASVRAWRASLSISSRANPDQLESEIARVKGEGWYRLWLEFVILLERAQTAASTDPTKAKPLTLDALRVLVKDTRPFEGEPRACDLYYL